MTKFGIYTSFYNCEKFVDSAFTQIENLKYDNFEWHITDDFSNDDTKKIIIHRLNCSTLKQKIKYVEQSQKKQMFWKPIEFFDESFEWIVELDQDDYIDKNALKIYDKIVSDTLYKDVTIISSDLHKVNYDDNSLHSISYIINDEPMTDKIKRYHPTIDYLDNISYYCFGHLRAYKNLSNIKYSINDMDASADDSYHVFWHNSYGRYLHVPRPLYMWHMHKKSESNPVNAKFNFNANFDIALNKLKVSDHGVDTTFNDVYLETCALGSYDFGKLTGNTISLWTKSLTDNQKEKLTNLYFDCILSYDNKEAEIHIVCLNHFTDKTLDKIIDDIKGKSVLFYYQNQKKHFNNEDKDEELNRQLNHFVDLIGRKISGIYWWSYIRHFIIKKHDV